MSAWLSCDLKTRGDASWSSSRFWPQSWARMSQGHTSVISPKSIEPRDRSIWQICVIHVVPHLGYVTTNTSDLRTLIARPTRTLSAVCMNLFRVAISSSAISLRRALAACASARTSRSAFERKSAAVPRTASAKASARVATTLLKDFAS